MVEAIDATQYGTGLAKRIKEFSSAFKIGIDLGTKTGGIALIKDNKVLVAKTFLEFHKETIEDRRLHRRNRRSRQAKRKRVALLRSWLLRQKIDGKQLPDPYKIKDIAFYKRTKAAKNWSEAVINGQDTSSEAFVKALTLVFRKRGQLYEDVIKEVKDMSYRELKIYIEALSDATEEEVHALSDEIKKRQETIETEREENRYAQLLEFLQNAAQKRSKAKSRKQRKDEIKQLVETFCKAHNFKEQDKWINELEKLLDKPVRKARFMNRILIRCNVCDKPTPKKARADIRELLYNDSIRNFLKAGRLEPTPETLAYYKNLYDEASEVREKILAGKALTKEEKKRMATLSRGLGKYKNKKYPTDAQREMLDQIKVLLFRKLTGRSRYCLEHLKARAAGIDVEKGYHGTVQKRHDRNIAQQNHDRRIINLLEYLLFNANESITKDVKENGIKYITIEAPEPKTKRIEKGKTTKIDTRKLKEKLFDDQEGICIYTGQQLSKLKLNEYEKDHIFPYSRDGPSIRDNLVLTTKDTNLSKGDKTPWEWLNDNTAKWQEFESRVTDFYKSGRITLRKMELLLNKEAEFPGDNPTELARTGARINNFIAELNGLLKKHGVPETQTLFERGKPLVQVVRGNETQRLRRQWNAIDPSFIPLKDRSVSFNHAEDAAIAASMPPNFWRSQIYRYTWHFNTGGSERPDFALPNIAPQWGNFISHRTGPIISVLGKTKYSWKKNVVDDTFYRRYNKLSCFGSIYKQPPQNAKRSQDSQMPMQLINEHTMTIKSKYYHKKVGEKRLLVKSAKGGSLITIKPKDGPERQIQINPTYRCVALAKNSDGNIVLQYKPITPILQMFKRGSIKSMEDELKDNLLNHNELNSSRKELRTHDIIWLPDTKRHSKGYFLVSKLDKSSIKVIPEDKVKVRYALSNSQHLNELTGLTETADKKTGKDTISLNKEDLLYLYDNPSAIAIR